MDYPKLNVIFDSRRIEKYEPLIEELKRQNITDYKIWPCIMKPDVVESINASHKMIVNYAKGLGLKEICIAEEDLMFPNENGWDYFLEHKPKSYDLYLACTYIPPISNNKICGFHLYFISEKFYDAFLSAPDKEHIDTAMDNLNGDYHFCYPFPALQRSGFSANNKAVVNYNAILNENDIYK